MEHESKISAHGGMKQWGVKYWETYSPVVNWISVLSLLDIAIIHELPSRSIDFVFSFIQVNLCVDVFVEIPLGMGVDGNRG